MSDIVKIVECPRDAWQALPIIIPAQIKAEYLRRLIGAGFTHIDAVSFVSPSAVPQTADSEIVLEELAPASDIEIIGIVVNEKGAQRAIETSAITTLGFPYSISPTFLDRNQRQTPEESLDALNAISSLGAAAGLEMVAYLSMAFGNPYDDPWSIEEVVTACELITDSGVQQVSLADTVGLATPERIAETLTAARDAHPHIEFGVHLHARRDDAPARIRAAYSAGCRRFDSAIGGLGGCPFAQDLLVGNIPTEILLSTLKECGATLPALGPLDDLARASAEIAKRFTTPVN